ncbi:MAG: adenosylcobalamin-dependent ribonucleoside-diphosphate reductase [Methylovirgula sp.]|nr:adenosylcobalamin-dependent ribonucleoside-diphosphate reductase [Methylovirgula sp.]
MEPQPPALSTQKPDVAAKHGTDRRTSARLFVGIKIAPEIAGELAKIANAVADPLVRRIPATDLHLTLVAPWNEEDIAAATQALTAVLKPIRSFDLAFEHVAYGPTRDRPKLLWAECAPTPELAVLWKLLSLAFHQIDNQPFRPHVTLARLGENGPRIAREYPVNRTLALRQKVRSIELFRSPQQQGRGYDVIASVPLYEEALDMSDLATDISRHVWATKYRYVSPGVAEHSIDDTRRRIAHAVAAAEPADQAEWERRFCALLQDSKFLPGGRIQAGAGTGRNVTLFNCFVIGTIEDSIPGIFSALQESATTMQQGGGIGCDFSTLRPRGTVARSVGSIASGPISFMRVWDSMCDTILSTGARRGAMMATLRCDHPDIEEFIAAKKQAGALRHFNLSVLVTDEFMAAVRADADWPLIFPASAVNGDGPIVMRQWSAMSDAIPCRVIRRISARALWEQILSATYDYAEPGVLFIDRINRLNNLFYRERIDAANPCGEIPLPPHGACDLGSLNLTCFVTEPFTRQARFDFSSLIAAVNVAVRLLDNVIDISHFPLPQQADQAKGSRRIGLGVTGLADALLMLSLTYGSENSLVVAANIMRAICHTAYRMSVALAAEKGSFPFFERDKYLQAPFIQALPDDIRAGIEADGVRNSHLLAIAPTGTISLLAGNLSSGIEPVFAASYTRNVLGQNGETRAFELTDYALALWRKMKGAKDGLPDGFVTAADLPIHSHLAMQAALQPFVDNSISKTINVPEECPFDEFRTIYELAYDQNLKGCTVYRPNSVRGAVLSEDAAGAVAPHCCALEREGD